MEMSADLLRRRLEIIGDHACRDSDPDGHVEALKTVSLEITVTHQRLAGQLPKPAPCRPAAQAPRPFSRALQF